MSQPDFFDPYSGGGQEHFEPQTDTQESPVPPYAESPSYQAFEGSQDHSAEAQPVPKAKANPSAPLPPDGGMKNALGGEASLKKRGMVGTVIFLVIVAVAIWYVYTALFPLERIVVTGLTQTTQEDAITASGLSYHKSMFFINEKDVEDSFAEHPNYIYESMQKDYLGKTIYLNVRNRIPVAALSRLTSYYLLDIDCMVMRQCTEAEIPEGFPLITGVQTSGTPRVGSLLSGITSAQLEAYQAIMNNLKTTDSFVKINLSDPESIYVETGNNLSLKLGDASYMSAKLRAYRWYMDKAFSQLSFSGVLDLSIPEDAKFLPDKKIN